MENNFDANSGIIDSENVKKNDGLPKRPPYTVTTLYYSCDSNIFQSSESSVQVVSGGNYNAAIGHCKQNFCELDIIAKQEKFKVNVDLVQLRPIKEKLKSLPMTTKAKGTKMNFRKKIHRKITSEEPNEMLCLANVLKDEETPFKSTGNRPKECNIQPEKDLQNPDKDTEHVTVEGSKVDETCQTKKKSRSKSRKRKTVKNVPQQNEPTPVPSVLPPFTTKFADLGAAKTMYFAELPNTSAFSPPQKPDAATEKEKRKNRKKSKTPKRQIQEEEDENPIRGDQQPEIVINKVESDFPALSSPGSLTTVPSQAFKKHSEISFDSIEVPRSTKTDFRKRNNSPDDEDNFLDDVLRKYKTDTAVYKGKHRKKHRTSPKLSSEEEMIKKVTDNYHSEQDTEVKVIYKVDEMKTDTSFSINKDRKQNKNRHSQDKQPENKVEKAHSKHKSRSDVKIEKDDNEKRTQLEVMDKGKTHKPEKDGFDKNLEKSNEKEDSILNLYVTNKSLQSESCTMITDEDFLKTTLKTKRKSRKSKSPTPSPEVKSKKSGTNKEFQELPLEDMALLENAKERKTKQRSKSRVAEDKTHKQPHKNKTSSGKVAVKKLSRKSASDLSKKDVENFDGHESIEGVQKSRKSRESKPCGASKQKKDRSTIDITNKTSRTSINTAEEAKLVEEKFPYKIPDTPVLSVFKEKKKRSKSYAPKKEEIIHKDVENENPPVTSRSYVFDGSAQPSDTQVTKRHPRSKKSKDRFYEELRRISTIQQVDPSRKRFKVVSKTIRTAHICDGTAAQSTEQSYVNRKYTGSNRFKTHISSEKEKEDILNLPIFNKSVAQEDSNFEKRTIEVYKKRSMKMVDPNNEISEMEEGLIKEEKSKKKKKIKKPVSRREISLSHLNVTPFLDTYKRPIKPIVRRTFLSEKKCEKESLDMPCKKGCDFKESSIQSEDTDFSVTRKESLRKFNIFTIIAGEKVLEISTRTIGTDGRISEGFTVSGSEPPKRLRSHDTGRDRLKLMAKVGKLHNTFLPSIEIQDGIMKTSSMYEELAEKFENSKAFQDEYLGETKSKTSAETMTDKETESNDDCTYKAVQNDHIPASHREILPIRTPVFLKTKRKFNFSVRKKSKQNFKKDVLGKYISQTKKIQTSTESHSNSDIQEQKSKSVESIENPKNAEHTLDKTTWQQKCLQKQEMKNSTRMSSAVKLMESSLQIIKEESQSTDSSSKRSSRKVDKETKPSESEIKETQTDFNVDDIDKIKEVITYLYNSMDSRKSLIQESVATITENTVGVQNITDAKITKQDSSSTETSSYHAQFKNFVKNVTPKFCGLKRSSKTKSDKKQVASDICISSRIPTLCRRPSTSQVKTKYSKSDSVISDSLSGSNPSSSGSDPKEVHKTKSRQNSKNFARKRSSSADVLSSGYFEKYKDTKELIEKQRRRRAESEDSSMRKKTPPIDPEFKSSTSMSDFSSLVISFKDEIPPAINGKVDVAIKKSEEKYVQCVLVADIVKELIDKNIGTLTEDERDKTISKDRNLTVAQEKKSSSSLRKKDDGDDGVNEIKTSDSKDYVDKSLQTSIKDEPANCKTNILYKDIPCRSISKKGLIDDLIRKVSSHSFISPRRSPTKLIKEKHQPKPEIEKRDVKSQEKLSKFKRAFSNKEEKILRSSVFSNNMSEKKKSQSKKVPDTDYINFIKLERHLEQVLGLYPSIFKAIRSHMDESTVKKLDKQLKVENPDLFSSCDTLATTIDTVTEYKNTDSIEKFPSFSESNLNKFNRYCDSLNLSGQEYHLQQFINSQNLISQYLIRQSNSNNNNNNTNNNNNNRKILYVPVIKNERHSKRIENKKDVNTTPYPYTDSSSNSVPSEKKYVCSKRSRRKFKNRTTAKKNKAKDLDSATRIFSRNGFLGTSSDNSSCCKENWSVASPLYSITTPSANLSLMGRSQSSTSLMVSKPTQTKVTKSKSVIEMSSVKRINRNLTIKHLIEANQVMKRDQANQNVLVVSVNSSCTVFATPSKFLAKVEKQLKKTDKVRSPKENDQCTASCKQEDSKKQVDEQSFHSIFFSDSNVNKSPTLSEQGSHKPFYIHKQNEANPEEFPDSLEIKLPHIPAANGAASVREEEDLGNFSADSLETEGSKCKTKTLVDDIIARQKHVQVPVSQNFLVYSSTVNYDKDASRTTVNKDSERETNSKKQQTRNVPVENSTPTTKPANIENTSNTLLSESGYESTKSRRTASIRNFFKRGGSLLDIFRNGSKSKIPKMENLETNSNNLTSFSNIWQKKQEQHLENSVKNDDGRKSRDGSPYRSVNAVYWSTIKRDVSPKSEKTTFSEIAGPSTAKSDKSSSTQQTKGTHMSFHNKSCACSDPVKCYQRQMDECHAYAEKVLLESQMRREGYYKQYQDFKEIPLELLIGKRVPNKNKYTQEISVQTKPKSKGISTQSRRRTKVAAVDTNSPEIISIKHDVGVKTEETVASPNEEPVKLLTLHPDIVVLRHESTAQVSDQIPDNTIYSVAIDGTPNMSRHTQSSRDSTPKRTNFTQSSVSGTSKKTNFTQANIAGASSKTTQSNMDEIPSRPSIKTRTFGNILIKSSQSLHNFFTSGFTSGTMKDQSTSVHISRKNLSKNERHESPPKSTAEDKTLLTKFKLKPKSKSRSPSKSRGCSCDGGNVVPTPPREPSPIKVTVLPEPLPPPPLPSPSPEKVSPSESSTSSSVSLIEFQESDPNLFIEIVLQDIVDEAMIIGDRAAALKHVSKQSVVQLPPETELEKQQIMPRELKEDEEREESQEEPDICRRTSEDFRKGLTDKEVFDKLLNSFEKEDEIAVRLSKDEEFFQDQIKTLKKDSDESIEEEEGGDTIDPSDVIYTEDPIGGKHRSTHFWEEKMKVMRAEEENPVKEDDIGTCFSRGFRPDNIALSGDACFNLNKQDRLKFTKGMLTNEESIIDFSERETPLDYLLALGFMVDEASNALKDEDIRSRLLAAITEARVWINKITTTQGTLLYLVAYKSRPKTMRYFLQLVEAIINKRINNAIKLDGFLRVLEKVEEGEIQMINILGADKFEDEENEEKIVKKQLRQLFITVYKIAEKEAIVKGKQLPQQAIVLLRILAAKYRAGLHPHLELIARYIGQELLITETQLEAAMIFLSRLDTAEVKLKEFEAYCDIKPDKKKKKTTPKQDTVDLHPVTSSHNSTHKHHHQQNMKNETSTHSSTAKTISIVPSKSKH